MNYEMSEGGVFVPAGEQMKLAGVYHGQIIRAGEVIDEFEFPNLIVNEGLNHILDVQFHNVTQVATWYIGLFEANYTPVAGLTAATITTAATECTAYDEATRQEFKEAAAASQSISNTADRAKFTFNATKTIYGAFLVSDSAKSGTSGKLFSAARFPTAKQVVDDDELLLTYTINAQTA